MLSTNATTKGGAAGAARRFTDQVVSGGMHAESLGEGVEAMGL
jgi:hypothetical protein